MKQNGDFSKVTTDDKFKLSLNVMADKLNEKTRDKILLTYNDRKLLQSYETIRQSGIYQKGSKSKVHRKIVEFPNPEVFGFVDDILKAIYGEDWLHNNKALRHDLVKPWHVVKNL